MRALGVTPVREIFVTASLFLFLTPSVGLFSGCEPVPISELGPDEGAGRIREHYANERWDQVEKEVNEYRRRHPYSKHAAEMELLLADAHFEMDQYPEAGVVYEEFIRKNTSHPKREYAMFRVAKSFDVQSPEETNREQDFSRLALGKYQKFLQEYPKGSYSAEARERVEILRRRLADHEAVAARFYWKKDKWNAAAARYETILKEYGQYADLAAEARERAAISYQKLADELEKNPKSDAVVYFRGLTPAELRGRAARLLSNSSDSQPSATR